MKKQLLCIFTFTVIIQLFIFYSRHENTPTTLTRPVFLVANSNNNYSEIYTLFPTLSNHDKDKLSYSKTKVRVLKTGSIIFYIGTKRLGGIDYNVYNFEGEKLLLKRYISYKLFESNFHDESLSYSIENNQNLINQLINNQEIDTEMCFQDDLYYSDPSSYLKKMLKEYHLEKDVELSSTRQATYNNESFSCITTKFNNTKTYFFVSQFISNENI